MHSVMHHSRATPEKQWDETRVLALQGVLRVFRTFAGTLALLPPFADAWGRLLKYVAGFATMGSVEVTLVRACAAVALGHGPHAAGQATVTSLCELLVSEVGRPGVDRALWEQATDVWDEITTYLCRVRRPCCCSGGGACLTPAAEPADDGKAVGGAGGGAHPAVPEGVLLLVRREAVRRRHCPAPVRV
jgi:hypothetical protein